MKKLIMIPFFLTLFGFTHAQVSIVPKLSLDMGFIRFGADTSLNGGIAFNPDVTLRFKASEKLYLGLGAGFYRTKSDSFYGTSYSVPVFVNLRWGKELFIDASIGYHIPLNSTGLGFVTGLYSRLGLGIFGLEKDGSGFNLGAYVDIFRLFGTSEILKYVPDGYVPVSSGIGLGAYMDYAIPISPKRQ